VTPRPLLSPPFPYTTLFRSGGSPAFGHVRHECDRVTTSGSHHVAHGDFDRKFRAVFSNTDERETSAVQLRTWCADEDLTGLVSISKGRRDEPLDRLADELTGRPAEHRLQRPIRHQN